MCGGVGVDEDGENVSAMSTITVRTITYPDPCPSAECSHDCLPIGPGMFSCQCPLGSYLDSQDNKTCTTNNPMLTPLVPSVQAVTGDYITLTCIPSGLPLSQSAVRWRVNGTSLSNMRSISSGQPMMSVEQDLGNTLTLTRATPEMGGVYMCELVSYPNVSANITVTIAPGCYPTALLTNAAVGSVVNVSCDSVHSGFNPGAAMTWKCTRHLNWEGEFSSCSFKENWQNPLVLLRYSVLVDLATAVNNRSAFETDFQSYLTQQLGAGVDIVRLDIVRINRTETAGHIGFTLILEITPTSQFSALNNLDLNIEVPQLITIANSRAFFDSSQSFNFVPSVNCSCPVLWVEIASLLGKRMKANVTLCRSPSYALSPCNCQDLFGERTCQCGELYTSVAGFCTLDVDQDRDPDFRDNCIGCCGAETYRGLVWPETPFRTTVPISCGMQIDSSFNDFSYVTRYCNPSTGRWDLVDSTGCTATSNLTQALLIFQGTFDTRNIELSPREAVEAELRFYYNPYGLVEIRSITLSTIARTPVDSGGTQAPPNSQSLSETIVTVVVMAFPANVSNRVLFADQAGRDKRNVAGIFFRDTYVYGYRATDTCECANFPSERRTFYSSCSGPPGNPCNCVSNDSLVEYGLICECIDPYAPVTSEDRVAREIGSVTCAADDDGDRIPNSEDNCPSVYDPTNACSEPDSQALVDGCPEEVDSIWMISWPATPRATLNTQHCSNSFNATGGATGLATRMCGDDGVWRLPNVMNCRSLDFILAEQNNLGANAVLANDPALNNGRSSEPVEISPGPFILITTNTFFFVMATEPQERVLFPNDIGTINNFLSTVADYSEQTTLFNRMDYPEEDLLRIVDNVLETSTNESWRQLNEDPDNGGSPQLLESTERIALSFASNLRSNPNSETLEEGVLQRKVERRNTVFVGLLVEVDVYDQDLTITPSPGNTFQSAELVPNISLPLQFLMERARSTNSNYTSVVTSVISNLQQYLPLRYSNNTVPPNSTVGSILLSTQVSTFSGYSSTLQDNPITMKFPINQTYSSTPKTCVFWSFSSQNVSFGGWSDENITTRSSPDASSDALCMSQHLTTFAVLVDVSGLTTRLSEQEALAFSIVSYIGCAISLVCLIATVIFLLTLRKEIITKVVNYVHLNLCISLICGLIVFLAGIQAGTSSRGGCAFVAFLLHYFFLAAFSWMLCEGIMLYNLLVKVFKANERKWIYVYTGLGWGIPVPFVILSVAIRWYIYRIPKSYDTTSSLYQELRACWLPHEEGVIAAFIVPMLIIIIINCVFVALAFKSLYAFKVEQTKRTDEEHAARKAGIALVKAFVIILPLLGLTWVIGLLAVNPYTTVFAWIFLFLNAFQGVFIFFFHVVRNDKVWPKLVGCLCGQKYKVTTTTNSTMKAKSSGGTSNSTLRFGLKDGLEMDTVSKEATTIENKMKVDDEVIREKAIPETSIPEREQVASTEPLMDEEENIK